VSVLFDGVDERITTTTGNGYSTSWPFSVAAVVKLTATTTGRSILSHSHYDSGFWIFDVLDDDILRFIGNGTNVNSTVAVPEGVWVFLGYAGATSASHRLYCYNYETASLVFDETSTSDISTVAAADTWVIGANRSAVSTYESFFNGQISWLAYWQQNMTSANFASMRASGPYAVAAPSVLWGFVDTASGGSGTSLAELQGSGDNGTLVNFEFDAGDGWRDASPYDTWRSPLSALYGDNYPRYAQWRA